MQFKHATLQTCHTAGGVVIVIDVLRAFTTAAYAFAAGVAAIELVSTVDEALARRKAQPGALIMGEVDGLPVKSFDFGNSPMALNGRDFSGRHFIQRTSSGTQGVVRSVNADVLLVSSFVVAAATVAYLRRLSPDVVTFVITGRNERHDGDEDLALADYLQASLQHGQPPDAAPFIERVYQSTAGQKFLDAGRPALPKIDLEHCVEVDRFDFAMRVSRRQGRHLLEKV